jgi:hypothetical protein
VKSRKSAKVSSKSRRADRHRESLRGALRAFETLEDRKLMTVSPWSDGMYYPPIGKYTAFLPPSITAAQYASRSDQQYGGGSSNSSGLNGEGLQPFINTLESEPNNQISQADYLNLGTSPDKSDGATVTGVLTSPTIPGGSFVPDVDYYAFDLRAGDIVDARLAAQPGRVFDLSIMDANRTEIIATRGRTPNVYPLSSPLNVSAFNPNLDLAFIAPATGRYYARVSDGDLNYTLTMRARRPALESQPVGTTQKIFLDFDGEFLRRELFGATGTARLSSLATFLPGWGLTAADESRVIDKIISSFSERFFGSAAIPATGGNGWYRGSGIAGQFDLEILNSRDHADPFGQPNVSRIIFGGTQLELAIPTVGIAQSVDTGNFDTAETAVVLLDLINPLWGVVPRAGNVPLEDILTDAIGAVGAHEAGHYFGAWHTLNNNASNQIMDTGGNVTGLVGVGPDGIYGTADDQNIRFGTDTYDPLASAFPFGIQNSAASMAFGLSTGTVGGATIRGRAYQDNNGNRVFNSGDVGLAGAIIYADANNNNTLDAFEQRTYTDPNGLYQLTVAAGTYILRELVPTGQKLVVPANNAHVVTVANGQVVTGRDFINERINPSITGVKWNDLDGDGVRDEGEPGIPGVFVYIDLDGDNRIDIGEPAAQTRADGSYTLSFPGPGSYAIREVPESGFSQTFPGPAAGEEHIIVLTGDPAIDAARMSGLHFGNSLTIDFGDAPVSYGVASSGFLSGLTLGTLWDAEGAPPHSADATGDDTIGIDDEDAINLANFRPLIRGSNNNPVTVTTTNTTGQTAYLQAWIDFNADGDFNDPGEHVISNLAVTSAPLPTLSVSVPSSAVAGPTFARLRLSTTPGLGPTGQSVDGEVEDYQISIVPELLLAVNDSVSVRRNSVLNFIDVLANDFRFGGETLEVINVGQPQNGLATFTAQGVLYTPNSGFIGRDTFTYQMRNSVGETGTATVTVDVNLFFDNPLAIDDSFEVPTNAIDFPLNVLANDIEGQSGALSIVSITQPDKGGVLTIATGNKGLRYTPNRDFGGTEFFTYTVSDAAGNTSIARGTIHTLPGARADDQLQIRLVATDMAGNPIGRIQQGQQFKIDLLLDDLRFDTANPSPELSAGVFAAYTDLLYNLQLVSAASPTGASTPGFNFAVNFFNSYDNGQTGDATIPGIINELGAFFDGSNMNRPNEVRLASVTFEAKAPGIASFLADPADVSPASNSLLFDTSSSPVRTELIRYLGTSLEIVGDGVVFPVAVDDSPTTPINVGAVRFPIDVLANDLPGSAGPLTIKSATNGLNGTTRINAGRIEYTPGLSFSGSDQFTYTVVDTRGIESTARVTVRVGSNTAADDIIDLPLRVTDLSGAPISQIAVGQQFQLRGYVRDLRTTGSRLGIFAAYKDVLYSAAVVSPVPSTTNDPNLGFQVAFGPNYQRVREGDILTRGVLNEIGAVATSDNPLGSGEQLLFVVTMTANTVGTANFVGDPADVSPFHDSLTYEPVTAVSYDKIRYGFTSLTVVNATSGGGAGEYTNWTNPLDVNADGYVSPIDALAIINALNAGGSRPLIGGSGEGEDANRMYVDTNGDGFLSPIDVLNVINFLNQGSGAGSGEGEASNSPQTVDQLLSADLFVDEIDELLGTLAPEIEQTWKKQNR